MALPTVSAQRPSGKDAHSDHGKFHSAMKRGDFTSGRRRTAVLGFSRVLEGCGLSRIKNPPASSREQTPPARGKLSAWNRPHESSCSTKVRNFRMGLHGLRLAQPIRRLVKSGDDPAGDIETYFTNPACREYPRKPTTR